VYRKKIFLEAAPHQNVEWPHGHPSWRALFQLNLDKLDWTVADILDAPLLNRHRHEIMVPENQWLIRLPGSLFGDGAVTNNKPCPRELFAELGERFHQD
jgi:hypothetical protein